MSYPVPEGKYRVMIYERTSLGSSGSPLDVTDLNELKNYLAEKGIIKFSLKYNSIIDDIPDWKEMGITTDELTQELFDWLVTKSYGQSKFLEIDTKEKIIKQKNNMENIKSTFKRELSDKLIKNLTKDPLYKILYDDITKKEVFPAIRNNRIDFYHKGGKLFQYDKNGFKTHIKYASVIEKKVRDYLTEKELQQYKLASNFVNNYQRIKENCANYSGIEALGVSEIYHRFPHTEKKCEVVVLDIEVSFQSLDIDKKQDRIDILIYNIKEQKLQFVEAKHFSNSEIWSTKTADVIEQIKKYEKQISIKKSYILAEYNKYIDVINGLFGTILPKANDIDNYVTLLIFGFDNDQKNGRLKKLITNNLYFKGVKNYNIGNVDKVVIENLWNAKILNK